MQPAAYGFLPFSPPHSGTPGRIPDTLGRCAAAYALPADAGGLPLPPCCSGQAPAAVKSNITYEPKSNFNTIIHTIDVYKRTFCCLQY